MGAEPSADRGEARTERSGGAPKCVRCGSEMEEGYLLDSGLGAAQVQRWIAGKASPATFLGIARLGGERKTRKVSSFRCSKCGYLESYAL